MKKLGIIIIAGGLLSACMPFQHAKHKFHHTMKAIENLQQNKEAASKEEDAKVAATKVANALKQAKRLRHDGFHYRAVDKLMPLAGPENSNEFAAEYAKVLISLDQAGHAEDYLIRHQGSEDPELTHLLGIAQASQGKLDRAEQTLQMAMNQAPDNMRPVIANNLALVLAQLQRLDDADRFSDLALRADPTKPEFARTVHLIDRLQGMEVVQNTIAAPPSPKPMETKEPETKKQDKPEATKQPAPKKPETKKPETDQSEEKIPETKRPEKIEATTKQPAPTKQETKKPETKIPEVKEPEVKEQEKPTATKQSMQIKPMESIDLPALQNDIPSVQNDQRIPDVKKAP